MIVFNALKPPTADEIDLTIDHPNVPQIVYSVNHKGGPNPREFGYTFEGKLVKNGWSMVSNFVNGPTLRQLTDESIQREERLPKWTIWQCGLTLLKVLHKMQCRNIVHNDITSSNIIVSTYSEGDESNSIDFGIAQRFHGTSMNTYRDASLIAEVLFCMMLNRPGADGFRECEPLYKEVLLAAQQSDWPYSRNPIEAIWDLHDFEFRSGWTYQVAIPTGCMRKWWKQFSNGLEACKVEAAQAGKKEALRIRRPIKDP